MKYKLYFFISILLFNTAAFIYVRYAPKTYRVHSSLLIRDSGNQNIGAENLLEGLQLFANKENIFNQIGILKSYSLVLQTVEDLNLQLSLYKKGDVKITEIYENPPFNILFDSLVLQPLNVSFEVKIVDQKRYRLMVTEGKFRPYDVKLNRKLDDFNVISSLDTTVQFNELVRTEFFSFVIKLDTNNFLTPQDHYIFKISDPEDIAATFQKKLQVEEAHEWGSILLLRLDDQIPQKGINFLDQLAMNYLQADINEKNEIVDNTIQFINDQLETVKKDLFSTEVKLEEYKLNNNFMDLEASSFKIIKDVNELQKEKSGILLNQKYFEYLLEYINENMDDTKIIAPSIIGVENEILIKEVANLNELLEKRASLSFAMKEDNPSMSILNLQIKNAKGIIVENVSNIIKSSNIRLADINNRIDQLNILVRKLPKNERELINIERLFNLNNSLYNYLLEKKAEAGIAKAANKSDHRILDGGRLLSNAPISPKISFSYITATILAIVLPYLFFFVFDLLDVKIRSIKYISDNTNTPLLGMVGKSLEDTLPMMNNVKSIVSESFRSLRINLKYLNPNKDRNIVGFTSTMSGEGKSFCAVNLALSISHTGEKVLLIDCDLRKPTVARYFPNHNHQKNIGLSNFLIGKATFEEILVTGISDNVDIIFSGGIPPNPSELLGSHRMGDLLKDAREKYDYILLDAPPVGVVSDYLTFSHFVDSHLFVLRKNFSYKESIDFISNFIERDHFKNSSYLILNDVGNNDNGYRWNYNNYYDQYYEHENVKSGVFDFFKKNKRNA